MKVNIKNYVARLKSIKLLDTLVEAVANSLHAEASQITIDLSCREGTDTESYIQQIVIRDNGSGFNIENQNSFNEFMSEYKMKLGGRGVGRFSYLKVFTNVTYESVYRDDTGFHRVKFPFTYKFKESDFDVSGITDTEETYTQLTLFGLTKNFDKRSQAVQSPEKIKEYLMDKLLIEFSLNDDFSIAINAPEEAATIEKSNIPKFEQREFVINCEELEGGELLKEIREKFDIKYYFEKGIPTKSYFCTERRTVKETGIKAHLKEDEGAIFLVSSDYMDKYVDDFRTKYELPKSNVINSSVIDSNLRREFSDIIKDKYPKIDDDNRDIEAKLSKKYPYLKRYMSTKSSVGVVDGKEIIKNAINAQQKAKEENIVNFDKLETKYYKKLQDQKIDSKLIDEFVDHIEKTNELNKENLVEFVWYSDTILTFLLQVVANNIGDESLIHNLLIKKNKEYFTSDGAVQTELNNMWVFGHQFMGYNYVASDKQISQIVSSLDQELVKDTFGGMKPDVFMAMPRENMAEVSEIVLFELKKIGVSFFEKIKGINQLQTYSSALRKNIESINMVWGFLLIDFDNQIEEYLEDQLFNRVYTEQGLAYSMYNYKTKLLLTVLDAKALLNMAKKRNEVFINILNGANE